MIKQFVRVQFVLCWFVLCCSIRLKNPGGARILQTGFEIAQANKMQFVGLCLCSLLACALFPCALSPCCTIGCAFAALSFVLLQLAGVGFIFVLMLKCGLQVASLLVYPLYV